MDSRNVLTGCLLANEQLNILLLESCIDDLVWLGFIELEEWQQQKILGGWNNWNLESWYNG